MAKSRKKKSHQTSNQPIKVHRYSAEEETKKAQRKKTKVRLIVLAVLSAVIFLILSLIF